MIRIDVRGGIDDVRPKKKGPTLGPQYLERLTIMCGEHYSRLLSARTPRSSEDETSQSPAAVPCPFAGSPHENAARAARQGSRRKPGDCGPPAAHTARATQPPAARAARFKRRAPRRRLLLAPPAASCSRHAPACCARPAAARCSRHAPQAARATAATPPPAARAARRKLLAPCRRKLLAPPAASCSRHAAASAASPL